MASVANAFLSLAAFLLPHERFALRAYVLGEGRHRIAIVFLTERWAGSAPSSAATAALPGAERGQGRAGSAGGRCLTRRPRESAALPGAPAAPAALLSAPHRRGLDQPPALPRGSAAGTSPQRHAPARPCGCFNRLSPGPPRPACPRGRARQPGTPHPVGLPLPPRGGAAVERLRRRHRAYGCLGSRGLSHPSRLGHDPVSHYGHTALFTRAAGEVPAVSWLPPLKEAWGAGRPERLWGENAGFRYGLLPSAAQGARTAMVRRGSGSAEGKVASRSGGKP